MNEKSWSRLLTYTGLIVLIFFFPLLLPGYWEHVFSLIFIKIILCLLLRQMMLMGLLNLSITAFMGIGAYFSAVMTTTLGFSFWFITLLSGVVCLFIGVCLSFPVLKLKEAYFFIGTVCFAVSIIILFSNFFIEIFGGVPGFTPIAVPKIKLMGMEIKFNSHISHYYLAAIFMIISAIIIKRLESTRYGLYWKAISQADRLLETIGANLFKYKMINFIISCFFAGISGSIYAHIIGIITPHDFGLEFLFILVALLVVGGIENFWGPIIGVVFVSIIAEFLRGFGQYELIGYGFILVLAMVFLPKGLVGLMEKIFSNYKEKFLVKK